MAKTFDAQIDSGIFLQKARHQNYIPELQMEQAYFEQSIK